MPDRLPLFDPSFREAGPIRIREEREPGAILAAALNVTTREARPLFTAVFAIAGPMVVLAAIARIVGGGTAGDAAGSLLDLVASLLSSAAVFGFVRLYAAGLPAEVGDVWEEVKALVVPLIRYFALAVLGLLALAIPLAVVGASLAGLGTAVLVVAGIVLFVGVIVYVVPPLSLAAVAVALDGMDPGPALRHVLALVRGRRGRVVLTVLLLLAVAVFALVVLSGVVGALVVGGLASGDPTGGPATALSSAVLTLVTLPVGVLSSLVWVFLYGSLVDVVEGASLGSDLDRLAGTDVLGVTRAPEAPPAATGPAEAPPESFRPPTDARPDARDEVPPADSGGFRGGGFQNP